MKTEVFERVPPKSWRALIVLLIVGIFNYLDRVLLSILQIPIQEELGLSDTQLGILLGVTFAVVYTVFGLPIGRLADKTSRKGVLSIFLGIWTALTALSGYTYNFITLLFCRMGVALGEASALPITQSLISDYFPKKKRGTAIAIFSLSVPIGMILGFLVGGWLSAELGWRQSFIYIGLIGFVMVPVAFFGLYDPKRGAFETQSSLNKDLPPMRQTLKLMWNTKSYRYILIATSLHMFSIQSIMVWMPQFYSRAFEMPLEQVGFTMALIAGGGGLIGMPLGGMLVDRLIVRDQRWYVWLPMLASAIVLPVSLLQFWTPVFMLSIIFGVVNGAVLHMFYSPIIAVTQSVMPARVRTFTGAFYMFSANLLSLSLGPLAGGLLSDYFGSDGGAGNGLRIAISLTLIGSLFSVAVYLYSAKTLRQDLDRIDQGLVEVG